MKSPAAFIDDPDWAKAIPEFREPTSKRHQLTHDDCSRIDVEAVAAHLMKGGTLGAMKGYEERPGQIDMLKAIARSYNSRGHLMIEAGTGVGKSLAYLVPSVLWSWTNDTTVVISTATRNLQSQLVTSDIPKALKVLGEGAANFKTALLKGRANYVCLRAVGEFFSSGFWTMSADEQEEMPRFIEWLTTTADGDLDGYDGLPRSLITCPGEECGARRCPYYSRCFVYRARKNASDAHLVIANHALVLAEATNPGSGILPAYSRLVLDEAHNLESIATEYLSSEFSVPALTRILNRLVRKSKGRRSRPGGALAAIDRQLSKGVLSGSPVVERIASRLGEATRSTVRIYNAAEELADECAKMLRVGRRIEQLRYRRQDEGARQYSLNGLFKPFAADEWDERRLAAVVSKFEAELASLVNTLTDVGEALDTSAPEGEFNYCGDIANQVRGIGKSLVEFMNETSFVLKGEKATHAYWIERMHPEKRPSYIRLVAAPLSVAAELKACLYDVKDSVVLSSATLRVGNDFRYMSRRLGFAPTPGDDGDGPDRYQCLTAASPFDYLRQSLVLAPDCLPDPSADPAKYSETLAALLADLVGVTRGRALVLFTSYEMMNAVATHARSALEVVGIRLLVQGEGVSRERMTRELKESSSTVLFGAQSFWEGVDVSGEALSCVVLARLPFPQVGDPVIEARAEKIDREGGSSFRDYMLPEAVIKFRQGFGRLIRTQSDRGVVVITDPRVVTKSYGAIFRKSIPTSVHTVTGLDELLERTGDFFG